MPDDQETPVEAQAAPPSPQTPPAADPPKAFDAAYVEELRREAATYRTKLREAQTALKEREEAGLSETDKLRKQLEAVAQQATAQRQALRAERARVAVMTEATAQGLDPALAAELLTPDKLEYDDDDRPKGIRQALKSLAERFPALQPSQARSANPARGAQAAETDEARRRRIYGGGVDPFDPAIAQTLGGGVIFPPTEER